MPSSRLYSATDAATSGGTGRSTSAASTIMWTIRIRNGSARRAMLAAAVGASIVGRIAVSTWWPVMAANVASIRRRWKSVLPLAGRVALSTAAAF